MLKNNYLQALVLIWSIFGYLYFNNKNLFEYFKTQSPPLEKNKIKILIFQKIYDFLEKEFRFKDQYFNNFLNTYLNNPDYNSNTYGLPKRNKYCYGSFLNNVLNKDNNEDKVYIDFNKKSGSYKILKDNFDLANKDLKRNEAKNINKEWDTKINNYFTTKNLNYYMKSGANFNCIFQNSNHLPGIGILTRNDLLSNLIKQFEKRPNNQNCFKTKDFFKKTYRLYNRGECLEIFEKLNNNYFKKLIKNEYAYFIVDSVKKSFNDLDILEFYKLKNKFKKGKLCGSIQNHIVIQENIKKEVRYKNNEQLKLRSMVLISSVKPLVVYFNEGYGKLSLDKNYYKFDDMVVPAEDIKKFLMEKYNLSKKDLKIWNTKIKNIISTLIFISRNKLLKDPRFYQVLAFDFILEYDNNVITPKVYDIKHSPMFSDKNSQDLISIIKFQNKLVKSRNNIIKNYFMDIFKKSENISIIQNYNIYTKQIEDIIKKSKNIELFRKLFNNNNFSFPANFDKFEKIIDFKKFKVNDKFLGNVNNYCYFK